MNYLFRYDYTTDAIPEIIDTLSCFETGFASFRFSDRCAFMDDWLLYHAIAAPAGISPVIRIVGNTAKVGFNGYSSPAAPGAYR